MPFAWTLINLALVPLLPAAAATFYVLGRRAGYRRGLRDAALLSLIERSRRARTPHVERQPTDPNPAWRML